MADKKKSSKSLGVQYEYGRPEWGLCHAVEMVRWNAEMWIDLKKY
jgi:hypothetical protein